MSDLEVGVILSQQAEASGGIHKLSTPFLDEERDRWCRQWQRPVTMGEIQRQVSHVPRRRLLQCLHEPFLTRRTLETVWD
jgi:hypothetical protein